MIRPTIEGSSFTPSGDVENYAKAMRDLIADARRYRRLRENWIDCDELKIHGRLSAIDSRLDELLAAPFADGSGMKATRHPDPDNLSMPIKWQKGPTWERFFAWWPITLSRFSVYEGTWKNKTYWWCWLERRHTGPLPPDAIAACPADYKGYWVYRPIETTDR